jgi:hypothetical protein
MEVFKINDKVKIIDPKNPRILPNFEGFTGVISKVYSKSIYEVTFDEDERLPGWVKQYDFYASQLEKIMITLPSTITLQMLDDFCFIVKYGYCTRPYTHIDFVTIAAMINKPALLHISAKDFIFLRDNFEELNSQLEKDLS